MKWLITIIRANFSSLVKIQMAIFREIGKLSYVNSLIIFFLQVCEQSRASFILLLVCEHIATNSNPISADWWFVRDKALENDVGWPSDNRTVLIHSFTLILSSLVSRRLSWLCERFSVFLSSIAPSILPLVLMLTFFDNIKHKACQLIKVLLGALNFFIR